MIDPIRIGVLGVAFDLLNLDDPSTRALMRKIVVLDARSNVAERTVEYTALCEDFALVSFGARIPRYKVALSVDGVSFEVAVDF